MAKIQKKGTPPATPKPPAKKVIVPEKVVPKPVFKNENIFIFSVLAAYIVIELIGLFHHLMWRDELQTWLVGASSSSFGEFLHNMKSECNPLLWYLCDFILSRFTDNPMIAQFFHLALATGTIYLILKYAPFTRLQKVLLTFSYFLFFEYSLIARGYALTVFFIFLFCALYQQVKSKRRYLILALTLVCLANTTGHGIIIAMSLLGLMVADYFFSEDISIRRKFKPAQIFTGILIVLIGVYISFKCISPPAYSIYSNDWFVKFDMHRAMVAISSFWISLIPIPDFTTIHFWNTNMFETKHLSSLAHGLFLLISLSIFLFCVLLYSKKSGIVFFYLAATSGVILFTYANSIIYTIFAANHYGFIFIAFVVSAWLAQEVKKSKFSIPALNTLYDKLKVEKNFTYLFTGLLALNMLGGLITYSRALTLPFSNVKPAAEYIVSHNLSHLPETGIVDYAVSPLSAFTKQPIYFPDRDTTGRFTTWGMYRYSSNMGVIMTRVVKFILHQRDSALYIATGDFYGIGKEKLIKEILFTNIANFDGAIVANENYVIYLARRFDLKKQMEDSNSYSDSATISIILNAGYDLYRNGKIDEAAKIFTTVSDKTHGKPVPYLHSYLGQIYSNKKMTAEAEKEFNEEISLNLQKEDAFFYLGMMYYKNMDYDKAIIAWDSTVSINPKNADASHNLGLCYLSIKKDYVKAMTFFEKEVAILPSDTSGYISVLVCAENSNNEQALIKYINILLDKGMSINAIRAKGVIISDELLKKINK